jgi:hypothetical protein
MSGTTHPPAAAAVTAEHAVDKRGQRPTHLGRAPVLGGARAGLAARVRADHASSVAIMQRGELGADTEITRAPWRAGRPAVRRLQPGGRAQLERWFPGPTPGGPGMRQVRPGGACRHRQPAPAPRHSGYPHGSGYPV